MRATLSSNALARALVVTPARLNEIVRERRGISADTALRWARYFGSSVELWKNLQRRYNVECARDAPGDALEKITPLKAAA